MSASAAGAAPVAIIGAGYAGLAAAVELAAAGRAVDVFDASQTLGGRARAVQRDGLVIDNGQHILIGAYRETLRLMRAVGATPERLLKRTPLRLEFPGEFLMAAPPAALPLPAPLATAWALLSARGLGWGEKWAAVRLMRRLQAQGFRIDPDLTVSAWLRREGTPSRQRRLLWEPLCIAALNTHADRASAQVMATVLRDSLAASREASDLLLPQTDLSALFPEPAAAFVAAQGGRVQRGRRIGELRRDGAQWLIDGQPYAQVVVAVAPYHLAALVPTLAPAVAQFDWEPIVTGYLHYPPHIGLPQPMLGIADGYAQWVFDRGALNGQRGLIAAVISAHGRHQALSAEELAAAIHGELRRLLPAHTPELPPPLRAWTITEKRATFACAPSLRRPTAHTGLPGLWLAGDYLAGADGDGRPNDYPATIEGAVRSGVSAARLVLQAAGA